MYDTPVHYTVNKHEPLGKRLNKRIFVYCTCFTLSVIINSQFQCYFKKVWSQRFVKLSRNAKLIRLNICGMKQLTVRGDVTVPLHESLSSLTGPHFDTEKTKIPQIPEQLP